ncbi:MAG TPA: histidine kinase [Pyrinomonadaceae bacterium]|nr:histidine kinase [Pyrinomonadaceae bacterium]
MIASVRFDFDGETGKRRDRPHGAARLGFIWGAWTLVAFFFASQIYFYFSSTEKPMPFTRALVWQFIAVAAFALSTPPVLWLARRYRIGRNNWRRNILAHAVAGVLFSSVWAVWHIVLDLWFSGALDTLTARKLGRMVFTMLDRELLVYCIIVLLSHASNYYQRYREGELRASQAQLQALKMQLHPHFLFNSLHSISALVHKDPEAADRMIARLGDFLRMTLDNSAVQEVSLRQELEFLNCYLDIERIRFQDRLTTRLDVDPRTLSCRVPNLILQPLVENAIRHGVAPRSAPGHVEVRAERRDGTLRLEVRDNGPGLPAQPAPRRAHEGGVGLLNTRARLAQIYGDAYRFDLSDDPRGGTIVTLEIPFDNRVVEADGLSPLRLSADAYASQSPADETATPGAQAPAKDWNRPPEDEAWSHLQPQP